MDLTSALSAWVTEISVTTSALSTLLIQKGILTEQELLECKQKFERVLNATTALSEAMLAREEQNKNKDVS